MGGFGEPVKKKKPVGVGRGQEAYQRQMKSYNGLIGAGAEGTDVYVHREASCMTTNSSQPRKCKCAQWAEVSHAVLGSFHDHIEGLANIWLRQRSV